MANVPHVEKTILGPLLGSVGNPDFRTLDVRSIPEAPTSNPTLPGVYR